MCVLNSDSLTRTIDFKDYAERIKDFRTATDVMTSHTISIREKMRIPPRKITILELKKTAA